MADTFKIIDYLTRNPEQVVNMLTTDADVDVMKLSAALANMLQEIQMPPSTENSMTIPGPKAEPAT